MALAHSGTAKKVTSRWLPAGAGPDAEKLSDMWFMLVGVSTAGLGQTRQDPAGWSTTSEFGFLGIRDVDFHLDRVPATGDLADLVERFWQVRWNLPADRRASVTLLPHPCVNLVHDGAAATVAGVGRDRFTYVFVGAGRVFGVKFRPGAFLPFLGGPVSALTDRTVPLATLWGPAAADAYAAGITAAASLDDMVALATRHLRAHWPPADPEVERVGRIVRALLF